MSHMTCVGREWIANFIPLYTEHLGPLLLTWFTIFIPAWISNYIHYNVWDEITYPFLNLNGATVEV